MHIGIIFQGPMKSRSFDCASLLTRYHRQAGGIRDVKITYCLSTWDTETIPEEIKRTGWPVFTSPPVCGFDLCSRQKQIVSTLNGAIQLNSLCQPDFVLKIRNDMQIDLECLVEHIVSLEKSGDLGSRMVFPAANRILPFLLCDFFFGGRPDVLIDFLKASLEFKDVYMRYMPEMDFPLKYFFARRRAALTGLTDAEWFLNIYDYPYVNQSHITEIQSRLWWNEIIGRHFVLAPKRILENAVWRGLPLIEQYGIQSAVFFETNPQDPANPFGMKLKPFQPMPPWSRVIQWCKGRLEFFRWRHSRPMAGGCLFLYKALDKMNHLLNKIFPPPL
jgi:hypothetical protein